MMRASFLPRSPLFLLAAALVALAVFFAPGARPAEAQPVKPNPPENVRVAPGDGILVVSWDAPSSGPPPGSYWVDWGWEKSGVWQYARINEYNHYTAPGQMTFTIANIPNGSRSFVDVKSALPTSWSPSGPTVPDDRLSAPTRVDDVYPRADGPGRKSSVATLRGILTGLNNGESFSFTPAFTPGATEYRAEAPEATPWITVRPFVTEMNATYSVTPLNDGSFKRVDLGSPSSSTVVTIVVTAHDGKTTATYRLSVQRGGTPVPTPESGADGICDRTQEVQDAIVDHLAGVSDCANVTDSHLASINTRLTELDVRITSSQTIKSGDFAGLSSMTALDLISDQISELPDDIFEGLDSLETLLIFISKLESLPEDVFDPLGSLKDLTVSKKPFGTAGVSAVHDRPMSTLPEDVFDGLDSLERLNLRNNRLSTLPEDVFDGLDSLEELNLVNNQLSALPEDVFDGLDSLEELNLHGNQLSALPEDVFDGLDSLESLYLRDNHLSSLPEDVFAGLSSLETLVLDFNQITALPEDVFDGLSNLENLTLSRNQIDRLPEDIFDGLDRLWLLNLSDSRIDRLPEDVFDGLDSLESLFLDSNQIKELPSDVFDGLSRLYRLELDSNQIADLPDEIFDGIGGLGKLYLHPNPGSPFIFTAELEQQGDNAVVVRVARGAPTDVSVSLSAEGGRLSAETVTVAAGNTKSDPITVTPSGDGGVTVNVDSAEFVGGLWGRQYYDRGHARTGLGDSLTLERIGGL